MASPLESTAAALRVHEPPLPAAAAAATSGRMDTSPDCERITCTTATAAPASLAGASAGRATPGGSSSMGVSNVEFLTDTVGAYLRSVRAYDVLPDSGKVVVLDVHLPLRLAFYALVEHDAHAAALWDSTKGAYAGILTTYDLCDMLRLLHIPNVQTPANALSEFTLAAWRTFTRAAAAATDAATAAAAGATERPAQAAASEVPFTSTVAHRRWNFHNKLVAAHPEDDIHSICRRLHKYGIHHMPIVDTEQNAVLAIISFKHVFSHFLANFTCPPQLFEESLSALGVGSFGADIVVVPESASVISVLNVLAERNVSSVPIVDDAGCVVDVYSRDDAAFLAHDPSLIVLDAPVGEVRRAQMSMTKVITPVLTCSANDTLGHAVTLLAATAGRADRLVCVDAENRVTGIVSLSDIFGFFSRDQPSERTASVSSATGPSTELSGGGGGSGGGQMAQSVGLDIMASH